MNIRDWETEILLLWSSQWRNNQYDGVSIHRRLDCLLNSLFRRRSKKASKLRVIALCEGNSSVIGDFPAQRASKEEMFPFDDVVMIDRLDVKQHFRFFAIRKHLCSTVNYDDVTTWKRFPHHRGVVVYMDLT